MIIKDEIKNKEEKAKPFTAERLREILRGIEPNSLVMFEDVSKKSKSKNNGKELIKDIIVQKQEYPNNNGEVAYQVILINEFLNLNRKIGGK